MESQSGIGSSCPWRFGVPIPGGDWMWHRKGQEVLNEALSALGW